MNPDLQYEGAAVTRWREEEVAAWIKPLWTEALARVPKLEDYSIPDQQSWLDKRSWNRFIGRSYAVLSASIFAYWIFHSVNRHPLLPTQVPSWLETLRWQGNYFFPTRTSWTETFKKNWTFGLWSAIAAGSSWQRFKCEEPKLEKRQIEALDFQISKFRVFATKESDSAFKASARLTVKSNLQQAFQNSFPGRSMPTSLT